MKIWQKIVDEQTAKGMPLELAHDYATEKVNKIRQSFNPYNVNGLSPEKAKELLENNGYSMRILGGGMNLDFRPSRVNVKVDSETNTIIIDSLG